MSHKNNHHTKRLIAQRNIVRIAQRSISRKESYSTKITTQKHILHKETSHKEIYRTDDISHKGAYRYIAQRDVSHKEAYRTKKHRTKRYIAQRKIAQRGTIHKEDKIAQYTARANEDAFNKL